MRGSVPSAYALVQLMQATGWSWTELMETPFDVVQRTEVYMAVRAVLEHGGTLTFEG